MKFIAVIGMLTAFGLMAAGNPAWQEIRPLVGQSATNVTQRDSTPNYEQVTNLSALGILGGVILFIVCKMLPKLQDKFVEQSKIFADAIQAMHTDLKDHTKALTDLRTHCAARGVKEE